MNMTFSPRVVGPQRADFYSLETLVASPQFAGKKGQELVLAIYNYFTSTIDGTYHFWETDERKGLPQVRRAVTDPVKMLNCYGWMICGQCSKMLYQLYRTAGLKTRLVGLPGHAVTEVFFDKRWHILDVDMWTWFRTPEGHIASCYELACDSHKLIVENTDKSNPCNLPDRTLESYAQMYSKCQTADGDIVTLRPHWETHGHTMDFQLRPGETLVRSQENRGCFHLPQSWIKSLGDFKKEWHGYPRERFEPLWTFGNGRWIYEPKLAAGFADFRAGLWSPSDLQQDSRGLTGPGSATLRIQSPYIFCGRPEWSREKITSTDGVFLSVAGKGPVQIEITDAEGLWHTVLDEKGDFARRTDITNLLDGRYECLIRMTFLDEARLDKFQFDGTIMTAPNSLPRLVEGKNPMELRLGDKHGRNTVPWDKIIDFRAGVNLPGQWVSADNAKLESFLNDWQKISPADSSKPVQVVWRFDAPDEKEFAWGYFLASVQEGPAQEPPRKALLEWSIDGKKWKKLSHMEISRTSCQWDNSIEGEMTPAKNAKTFWVRITTDSAVIDAEFHGHLDCDKKSGTKSAKGNPNALRIVHCWREAGQSRYFEAPGGKKNYTIRCGQNPLAHTIEMSAPSVKLK